MTQDEYTSAKAAGQVQQATTDTPSDGAETPQTAKDTGYTLDDFLPILVALLAPQKPLAVAPTFTPKTLLDCIQFFDDGTTRALYLFMNGAWRSVEVAITHAGGRSYLSSSQSILTTFNTKILFDTNDYANGITWDAANNRFTCVTAGDYLATASLQWSPAVNYQYTINIRKNGSNVSQGGQIPGNYSGTMNTNVSDRVTLAVGDYIEVFVIQYSPGSVNVNGGSALSYLSITQVA